MSLLRCIATTSFFCLVSLAASAQTPVAKPAQPTTVSAAPKHNCTKPVTPEKFTSGAQQDEFQAAVEAFRGCLMDYRNRMQQIAKAHIDAGNAAATEFNEYIKELNAATDKANAEAAKAAEKK